MTKEIRLLIALGTFFILLIVALMWAGNEYNSSNPRKSPLYLAMSSFQENEGVWEPHPTLVFQEDSAEDIFLQGMDLWATGDYKGAKLLFGKCLTLSIDDPALPVYAYCYLNDCILQLEGNGSKEAVSNALMFMAKYPPAANNTTLIWRLVKTLISEPNNFSQGVAVLENYLDIARHLELHTNAWIMNTIAMLEYNSGEYAKSIRLFYDVEILLENQPQTPEIQYELLFAREYIANTQFFLEDYESASHLYQKLVYDIPKDGSFNHYNCYLNLAAAYLELGKINEARTAIEELYHYLPRVNSQDKKEVVASIQDIWANISLAEGNLEQAQIHLQEIDSFYQENDDSLFVNGKLGTLMTKGKYLVAKKQYTEAQALLETILHDHQDLQLDIKRDFLEILVGVYQNTNQKDKLLSAYEQLLHLNSEFIQTVQRAYLEFSQYYRENTQLKRYNAQLKQNNVIAILGIVIISCSLIIILVLLKLLSTKNLTDQLTGVYNRKKLNQLNRIYRRKGTPELFSVVMLDIDYFKLYNDTYGHLAGDTTLKQVAQMLATSVRNNDYVIRYGGEEFLVLLNKVSEPVAQAVCQRIHQQLEKMALPHRASKVSDHVTVSVGMCHQQTKAANSLDKLIQQADQCLYQSKEDGRNRTTTWEWETEQAQ